MEEVGKRSYANNTHPTSKFSKKKDETKQRHKHTGRNENMTETN
jgi:hypothetical protein